MSKNDQIKAFLRERGGASTSAVFSRLQSQGTSVSLVTVRRLLQTLVAEGALEIVGKGRAQVYKISPLGVFTADVDARAYCALDPDKRPGSAAFNFELFPALTFDSFSKDEREGLEAATSFYHERIQNVSETLHKKELERFVIELSWKSSRIEGNTYTLLDTEILLRDGILAPGHTQDEAQMILNHKKAFAFIYAHREKFQTLTRGNIEDVHKLLVADLRVQHNLRAKPVGVTGSKYRPLDNVYQIEEAIEELTKAVGRMKDGYAKALVTLLGISYIQPFEDGNKRTGRLMANALLLAHGLAPLSYRSVDEVAYREATLVFYELNSLAPLKKIFIEQYDFAARNYLVG